MSQVKREREWEESATGGPPSADQDVKRPRLDASPSLSPSTSLNGPVQRHPIAILDSIRAKLQNTADPHLQARLLLQYSSCAASPGAKTAAAIDFLFSFLQQNQTQTETQSDGQKDATGSGAIVVGAIVRGLRQLLAVKATVVEPMIQVDAMGEQLMQCMSVGEDFKLRRDMMRIVVDCLMLTKKFDQVEKLLGTCVKDHDAGMQAICLKGYLRLHEAGRCFVDKSNAVEHFDRLAAFVLFSQSEKIRILAAQVLVALADLHPQIEVEDSKLFPSDATAKATLFLPEKAFYVLCMAGGDPVAAVRVEIARCLRGFSRVVLNEVVEHALMKTQIDEAVVDVAPETVKMNTRRMMSSGVLLSLLEDSNVDVAAEASRTIATLCEKGTARDAGKGRLSQRVVERSITAHFDVLPRTGAPTAAQLRHVLETMGKKCAKVLEADVPLIDRLQTEVKERSRSSATSLFFLKPSTMQEADNKTSATASTTDVLRSPPADGKIATHLKAIQRLSSTSTGELDVALKVTEILVRLRQHVHVFPDAAAAPAPAVHSYVSMEAMLSTSPSVSSTHSSSNADRKAQEEADQAFGSLQLPAGLIKGCQEMLDLALSTYVKAFALSSAQRTELLQIIMLGRMGVSLGSLQDSTDSLFVTDTLRWIVQESTRLRFLFSDNQDQGEIWFPNELLGDINSLNGLKRAIVAVVCNAWPVALLQAGLARSSLAPRRLTIAQASIREPATSAGAKPEPREITANWPFAQRVRFAVSNLRDITQLYVKSVLPNGDVDYHHVPTSHVQTIGPRKHTVDHTITLTISPFSDPTTFAVAVCLGHPALPGSTKPTTPRDTTPLVFTDISGLSRVAIFHRTTSTLRHGTARP